MMESDWQIRTIGELCSKLTDGSHNPPKGLSEVSPYRMISSQNVFDDRLDFSNVRYLSENDYIQENRRTSLQKGDVLLTIVGSIGRSTIITSEEHIVLQRSVAVLRPKEIVLPRYLMYALIGSRIRLEQEGHGIAQKGIYLKQLSNFTIPIPASVDEQQRIVAELDLLSSIVEKKKAQIRTLDELTRTVFYEMFGDPQENTVNWDFKLFKDVFRLKSGDGLKEKEFIPGKYPVYGGNGISGYHNAFNKRGKHIIIGRVGAYCGNVRFVDDNFWLTDNAFDTFFDLNVLNYQFACGLLTMLDLHKYANHAAQPVISNTGLKDIIVIIPPMNKQNQYADRIKLVERQKEAIAESLNPAKDLLAGRMDNYFSL